MVWSDHGHETCATYRAQGECGVWSPRAPFEDSLALGWYTAAPLERNRRKGAIESRTTFEREGGKWMAWSDHGHEETCATYRAQGECGVWSPRAPFEDSLALGWYTAAPLERNRRKGAIESRTTFEREGGKWMAWSDHGHEETCATYRAQGECGVWSPRAPFEDSLALGWYTAAPLERNRRKGAIESRTTFEREGGKWMAWSDHGHEETCATYRAQGECGVWSPRAPFEDSLALGWYTAAPLERNRRKEAIESRTTLEREWGKSMAWSDHGHEETCATYRAQGECGAWSPRAPFEDSLALGWYTAAPLERNRRKGAIESRTTLELEPEEGKSMAWSDHGHEETCATYRAQGEWGVWSP